MLALAVVVVPALAQLPTPIIDVGFNEAAGTSVTNSGSAGGLLTCSTPAPYWTNNVPTGVGGSSSVDFQTTTGNYYVESPTNYPQLAGLAKFTIAGWVNCRSSTVGAGGNRIVTWIRNGGNGVDLVYQANGSLRLGINQWPDASGNTIYSSVSKITTDANAGADNWRFFAVTYDSTLGSGHVKFYFGNNIDDAALDVALDYSRGAVGNTISNLCIGAFNRATRSSSTWNRMFRGLIDEVKVFGDALTPEQILSVQRGGDTSAPAGFALEPASRTVLENQPVSFSVVVTGTPPLYVQWQRNNEDMAGATSLTYSIPAASMADDGAAFRVIVTNAYGQATSSNAILTVIRDEVPPAVLAVTTERTARNLTNLTVKFSEPVDAGSAQEPGNYVLNDGSLTTYSAVLQPDLITVLLTIDPLTPETPHTLFISGVTDRAGLPNVMSETNWVFTGPPTRLPPVIAVRFEEGTGTNVANTGLAGGTLTLSTPVPTWANNVPLGLGSASSVDFGTTTGNYYVESPTNYPQLTGLTKFTIAGWINNRSSTIGGGGNRIVAWNSPNSDGVDLVYQSDGSLQVGINQWPDNVPARSSAAKITTDADAGADNWRFFAVTYDSTLASGQVKFYFGSNADEATLDVATTYARGAVGSNIRPLVIGHFNNVSRATASLWDRMFRGLIDEVQVFDDALSLEEIVAVQRPGGLDAPAGFTLEPVSQTVLEGQPATFSVVVTGTPPLFVQWQRDSTDIVGANGLTYTLPATLASDDGAAFRVIVSNAWGNVTSSNAILTVISDLVPPTVIAVTPARSARNLTNVTVQFSEPVDAGSAQEPGNYILNSGSLTTYSAALQPDLTTVLLTVDPLTPDVIHTLTILGVSDRASLPNVMVETNWTFTGPPVQLPPIVAMRFAEAVGNATTNSGTLGGSATFVQQNSYPVFSTNVPVGVYAPAGNLSAVDFGDIAAGEGARAIDLTTALGPSGTVGALSAFTVCGWINARNLNEGWGGNRIAFALSAMNGPGFDIVQLASGALRIGVNEWPDNGVTGGGPLSTTGKITADAQAGPANWVFFAVTYDSSVSGGEVCYYFGKPDQPAQFDLAAAYPRGPIVTSGQLTVGNFSTVDTGARTGLGPDGPSRVFRGLIDDLQVFDEAFSLEQIQGIQITTPTAPTLTAVRDGDQIVISWDSPASFQLQYRDNVAEGMWEDETSAPEVNGNVKTVRLPITEPTRFYRLKSH